MAVIGKTLRYAAFAAVLAGLIAAPALARLDVYHCMGMRSTHIGRCCGVHASHARQAAWRAERRPCCELQSKGTEPPPAHAAGVSPIALAPAGSVVAELVLPVPLRVSARRITTRSRAPPSAPLWLQHQSFLL